MKEIQKNDVLRELAKLDLDELKGFFCKCECDDDYPLIPEGRERTSKSYLLECLGKYYNRYEGHVLDSLPSDVLQNLQKENPEKPTKKEEVREMSIDSMIKEIITERVNEIKVEPCIIDRNIIVRDKAEPKNMEGVLPEEFERILQLASQRVNTLLVGPTGCGKTYIAEKIAESLGMSFASLSCSAGMSESQLAGWLLPTGDAGKFEYCESPFISSYENGGVFLLDELDASDSNVIVFINTAIAGNTFHLPQRLGKTEVKRHPDFVLIAAANTHGHGADSMFVGRNQLDAATLSRFKVGTVNMDYSNAVERSIVHPKVLEWGLKIRMAIKDKGLRREMSTRNMIDITKMVDSYGWTEGQWSKGYFSDWSEDDRERAA